MSDHYCNEAVVKKIEGDVVSVEMTIHSACASCHAKSACMNHERKQEIMDILVKNPSFFTVGETVSVQMHKSVGHRAVVYAYLLPVVVLVATLLGTYAITKNEPLAIALSFIMTILYFLALKLVQRKIEENITFTISKIEHS